MGLIKATKTETIRADAARAKEEGHTVFVSRYWDEIMAYQGTGSIRGATEAIEMVEAEGWRLEHVSYAWVDSKRRGLTIMVFRV